jgi:hypothetical protein
MCCSFVISLRLVLEYFSTVLPNFYLWKQGLSDVLLLLWFLSLRLVLRVFFNSPTSSSYEKSIFNSPTQILPMKAGIEWCAALCDSFFTFVLEYFSTVLPILPMKAGIEWCAALCDSFLYVWSYFSTVPPNSTYESRDWVMCCSLWFLSLRLVLRVFSTVLPNFYLWKQGLSDVLLFCDFLYVWS